MDAPPIEDLVVVHLWDVEDPDSQTTAGICDALGVGTSVSERVAVLSALASLREQGLLEQHEQRGTDRVRYTLTDRGVSTAVDRYEAFADRPIEIVEDGDVRRCSALEATDVIDAPSIATVLDRCSEGRIRLDDVSGDAFVGREDELASIDGALDAVRADGCGVVSVVGERGVGKTELLRRATERADATVVSITCRSDPGEPFGPIREALADHGEADVFDRSDAGPERSGVLPELRTALFRDVRDVLDSLASSDPVLVTVDDLHEAGSETVELLEFLVDSLPAGVLVVLATRPIDSSRGSSLVGSSGDSPPIDCSSCPEPVDVAIELGPLGRAETRELVVRLLGDRSVPSAVTDRLYERTGGVPLFVVGLVARLREDGTIDPDAGIYPDEGEPLPIPEDISAAILTRLDALDEVARSILEDAAVIGHTADRDVLEGITEQSRETVQEYLDLFAETGLFESTDPPRFLSEVIREVVLDGIDEARKRRRHRAIAEAYEDVREEPPRAAIARHYERAGDGAAALEQYREAGEQAMGVYAHEAALEHYERALSLARDLDAEDALIGIAESIGRVYYVTGEYDEADRYFEFLREGTDDPERLQRSYRYQAEMAEDRGNLGRAEEYARAGLDAVEEPGRISCRLIGHLGWYQLRQGNLAAAEEQFQRQYDLAERLDDRDRLGGAYHNLGTIELQRGNATEAIEYLERAVDANEQSGAVRDALASYNNLSSAYDRAGRIEDGIDALETARDRAAEIGDRPGELLAAGNLALFHHQRGNLDRAEAIAERIIDAERAPASVEAFGQAVRGSVLTDRCRFDAAKERIEQSVEFYESAGNTPQLADARCSLARIELYQDNVEAAREHLDAALAVSDGIDPELRSLIRARLGDVDRAVGDFDGALDAYERSLEHARSCGNLQSETLARFRLGVTRSDLTGGQEGLELARRAVEDAATFDAPLMVVRANAALARCHRNAGEYGDAADALSAAEAAIEGIDAPLYACWIRTERALLAADRGDADAHRQLDAAAAFADEHGVAMLERRCQRALERNG